MQITNQNTTITTAPSNATSTTVNKFDDTLKDQVSFNQLPSLTNDVAILQPTAVLDKNTVISAIVNAADAITVEHNNFRTQFVEGGRKAMYALLSKIYALALEINNSDYRDSILKELRYKLISKNKIKTQKNSNAITMIVRWVVGANRQTAHNYSKALQAAFDDNITAEGIEEYFKKRGGLQSVKSIGQKKVTDKKEEIKKEFDRFVTNADRFHSNYSNTHIEWKEEVYGDMSSTKMMIIGASWGGGKMQGFRAFRVSNNAYHKISKILSDDFFKNQNIEDVTQFIDEEVKSKQAIKKTS